MKRDNVTTPEQSRVANSKVIEIDLQSGPIIYYQYVFLKHYMLYDLKPTKEIEYIFILYKETDTM